MAISRMMIHTAALAVLGVFGVGCQSGLYDENIALHRQNRELQSQLDADNAQLHNMDPNQIPNLQAQIQDRDRQIADLKNNVQLASLSTAAPVESAPVGSAKVASIAGMETTVDTKAGTLTVTLPGDVLFDSGSADLKPSAQITLDKVAVALERDYGSKKIRVEGHTDSDPITRTKNDWEDNLDLSLARAAAVSRYLEAHGVSPKLVTTSGLGASHPRSGNKVKNRRVEIVVVTRSAG